MDFNLCFMAFILMNHTQHQSQSGKKKNRYDHRRFNHLLSLSTLYHPFSSANVVFTKAVISVLKIRPTTTDRPIKIATWIISIDPAINVPLLFLNIRSSPSNYMVSIAGAPAIIINTIRSTASGKDSFVSISFPFCRESAFRISHNKWLSPSSFSLKSTPFS